MKWRPRLVTLGLSAALASCGGGGGSAIPAPKAPIQPAAGTTAHVRLTIPNTPPAASTSRRRNFLSSATNGATVAAGAHNGTLTTTTFDLSSASTLCQTTSSVRSCTLSVVVPVGNDDFNITIYDAAPVSGAIPTTAHVLGTASVTQIVSSTAPTTIALFAQGVIAGYGTIMPLITFPDDGGIYTQSMMLNPSDFSNQPITTGVNDPYSNPIMVKLVETDGSGLTHLTVNSADVGTSTTLTQSSQTLGVKYLSGGAPGYFATVTLSANGVLPASFDVAPMFVTSASPYYSSSAGLALELTATSQNAVVSVSEASGTNTYAISAGSCTYPPTIGSVTGSGANGSFAVTAGTSGSTCGITVTDSMNTAATMAYSLSLTNGGVSIGGISEYGTPVNTPNVMAAGSDGNLYVGSDLGNTIWGYNTSGSEVNWSSTPPSYLPVSMAAAPDGNIWFVAGDNNAYVYNPQTWTVASPAPGVPGATKLTGIALGPDGNMWMIDNNSSKLYDVTPSSVVANTYTLSPACTNPTLIANGGLAHGEYVVCPAVTSTGALQRVGAPVVNLTIPGTSVGPAAVAVDASGNLWIAEQTENEIDEYAPTPCATQLHAGWCQYPIGASDSPAGLAFGGDGNLYFTAPNTNSIGKFNVTTHTFTHFAIPSTTADPSAIVLGGDGRIWFAEGGVTKIGALTP